jgi:dipeptidyl aminopeptidase/acylaminoacyl peptidase
MMRHYRFLLMPLVVVLVAACSEPSTTTTETADTAAEPVEATSDLLDRSLFFDDPEIAGSAISPNGEWISFRKPFNGVMNIWVKTFDEPFDAARPLTADTRPVGGYFWTEDSRYVLYAQDKDGNENFHVYRVDPTLASEGIPDATNLTPYDGARALIYAVPENNPREIIVGLNDRNPALHDLYRVNINNGDRELIIQNDQNLLGWVTDHDGDVRLAGRMREDAGVEMLVVEDGQVGRVLYACDFGESCNPVRFHKNGEQVYFVSNKGETDLTGLYLVDVATGDSELIHSDPEGEVDFGGALFSDRTEELVGVYYVGADTVRTYALTDEFQERYDFIREHLPDGILSLSISTEDDSRGIISVSSDVNPGSTYYFDFDARTIEKLYDLRPELPSDQLASMQAIRYTSRDGVEIPAYLVTPKGVEAKNLPVVIFPHGGPWGRDTWGYHSMAQFLANRGYAVLLPNFRGSAGFGKAFLNAGDGEWGTGIMQHDISDGVKYLIDEGIADPERIGIMGGSYGGYATLAGMAFTPELYAVGVSIVGPSNIITLLKSVPPYWIPQIKMFHERVGDPDDPEDRERLMAQSPFFHAKNIKAPLLVIQGANDPRVKQAESDQIVVAMRELERLVEYLVAPDEGHGFRGKENRMAMNVAIEKFLAKHLGGRIQESVEPNIAAKLKTLTVDVATVELPENTTP